ncbi:uncharacterized protein [Henckelia pumila]|uniref:uncharacterized protein n=1 Tax=Henckelia pumila TaxID=405737 RepID=UPI003C6E6D4C
MTGNKRMLSEYIPGPGPKITFADNSKGTTMGKAKTPKQNGVAERRNRTIKEAARTMIDDSVPVISYFKVFGCKCFIHNNGKTHLTALDVRSDPGLFLGYSSVSKAYRVFNNKTLTVEESVHVVFDETSVTNESPSLNDISNRIEDSKLDTYDEEEIQIRRNREIQCEPDQVEEQRPEEPSIDNEIPINTGHIENQDDQDQQGNTDKLGPSYRWSKIHPPNLVIGNPSAPLRTKGQMINELMHAAFISQIEHKKVEEALLDTNWIEAMKDELNQFERNYVWHLVPRSSDKSIIGTRLIMQVAESIVKAQVGLVNFLETSLSLGSQLRDYGVDSSESPIFCDNTIDIAITYNLVLHSRTKNIDIRHHFIQDNVQKKYVRLEHISTDLQMGGIFA